MFKEVCQVSGGDSVSQQVLGVLGGSFQILMGFSRSQEALMCLGKVLVGLNRSWWVLKGLGRFQKVSECLGILKALSRSPLNWVGLGMSW